MEENVPYPDRYMVFSFLVYAYIHKLLLLLLLLDRLKLHCPLCDWLVNALI